MPPWFKRFDLRQCCGSGGSSGSFFTPMDCFVIETDACILPEWFVRILRFGPRSLMFLSVWLRVKVNASICVWVLGRKCVWVLLYVCLWANKGVGVCVCFGECVIVFCVLECVCGIIREPASTAKNIKKIRWKCVKEKPVYFQLAAEWFTLEPIFLNPTFNKYTVKMNTRAG